MMRVSSVAIGKDDLRPAEDLRRERSGYRYERALVMEFMYRYGKMSQSEIGEQLGGMDYSAVSRERKKKIREKMEVERKAEEACQGD
jgi:DNA-binding MarR family transcriptional regulator